MHAPPPASSTLWMRLSAVVAVKKSSERAISPITVSVTERIACSTSCGTTSWFWSFVFPPSLIRSASSKEIDIDFWISSVYWLPPVVMSRVKAGMPFWITLMLTTWAPMFTSATTSSGGIS